LFLIGLCAVTWPRPNLDAVHRLTLANLAVGADGSSPRSPPLECCNGSRTFYSDLPIHLFHYCTNFQLILQEILAEVIGCAPASEEGRDLNNHKVRSQQNDSRFEFGFHLILVLWMWWSWLHMNASIWSVQSLVQSVAQSLVRLFFFLNCCLNIVCH
jgi:hypothetical protein